MPKPHVSFADSISFNFFIPNNALMGLSHVKFLNLLLEPPYLILTKSVRVEVGHRLGWGGATRPVEP